VAEEGISVPVSHLTQFRQRGHRLGNASQVRPYPAQEEHCGPEQPSIEQLRGEGSGLAQHFFRFGVLGPEEVADAAEGQRG
jgi:hypothetical protein